MSGFHQILRLIYINFVLTRHGLDEFIFATHLFRPIRYLNLLLPWNWLRRVNAPRGERIRLALEDLGPIFVKFGQILSTRRDLLPDDIADELAKLQDNVPPFSNQLAREIIEKAYGEKIETIFSQFSEQPLASASIAQVHAATLPNGDDVIIKVLRPNVEKIIRRDLIILNYMARLAERFWDDGKRLRPVEVVDDYKHTILDELDLMREAANASQLKRNFHDSNDLYVPDIYWSLARKNVMVMERIHGHPVNDISSLKKHGVDLKKLSERGVEIFFTQVFKHNFFHADMHPGNVFVSDNGQYIAIDFGIMGTLSHDDQRYLAENFLAFFNRDYHRVAELHVESGWVPKTTRIEEFESAIRSVCEPIFERPLKDISFGNLLLRLFQTARRFDMPIQPQLVLLQKTLLNIEGLGRQLYPDLDLWQTAKPFLERWMNEHLGVRGLLKSLKKNAPLMAEKLPELPLLLHEVLDKAQHGKLEIKWKSEELEKLRKDFHRSNRRNYATITGAALIVSATIFLTFSDHATDIIINAQLLGWVLGGVGALALLAAWPSNKE